MDSVKTPDAEDAKTRKIKRILPLIVGVSLFMDQLDATIVNTAIPAMSVSLGVTPLSLKAVMTSYLLSLAVCITLSGWMADRFGSRRVFASAVALFTFASFLCGISNSLEMLIASRVLQGVAAALMMPVGRLLIVRTFDKSELLKAMNFVIIPALMGPLLGPTIGGLIIHWFSWQMIFFINIPIGIAILYLVKDYVPQYQSEEKKSFDFWGFLLFGTGFGLLTWMLDLVGNNHPNFALIIPGGMISLLMIGCASPLLNLKLFKIRTFRISVLGGFFSRLGLGALPFLLPFFYQIGLGFPAWKAGLLTIPTALAAISMKVFSSKVLATLGYKRVLILNTALIAMTFGIYAFIDAQTSVGFILLINLCMGLFSSLQMASINSMAFADISKNSASMASTISSSMQQMTMNFGLASGALIAGFFLQNMENSNPEETIVAVQHAFLALGLMTAASVVWFFYLRKDDGAQIAGRP
jgi:EmrB/QacA subfamily drug resistance transporter